jgi:hypothetical protein
MRPTSIRRVSFNPARVRSTVRPVTPSRSEPQDGHSSPVASLCPQCPQNRDLELASFRSLSGRSHLMHVQTKPHRLHEKFVALPSRLTKTPTRPPARIVRRQASRRVELRAAPVLRMSTTETAGHRSASIAGRRNAPLSGAYSLREGEGEKKMTAAPSIRPREIAISRPWSGTPS